MKINFISYIMLIHDNEIPLFIETHKDQLQKTSKVFVNCVSKNEISFDYIFFILKLVQLIFLLKYLNLIKYFQASREDWGRGNLLGTLPEENFQFGQWKPVENSIEDDIQTTTTHKPLAQKRDFPIDSKFQIQSLDLLHKYADQLYNKNIPRTLQPIAQKRVAVYIKPLGELGDLPQSAPKLRRSSSIQNGHQIDPESLYTMPYDNVGIQEPWRPTSDNNSYTHSGKSDKPKVTYNHMPKDTNKLTLDRMPKNEDLGSKPFGDTVLQASLSVSGNKPKKPKNSKNLKN